MFSLVLDEFESVIKVILVFWSVFNVGIILLCVGNWVICFLMVFFVVVLLIEIFLLWVIMVSVVVLILMKLWNCLDVIFIKLWCNRLVNYKFISVLLLFSIDVKFVFMVCMFSSVLLILKKIIFGVMIYFFIVDDSKWYVLFLVCLLFILL